LKKALAIIIAGVALVLGLFYLAKSGMVESVAAAAQDSIVPDSSVSSSNETSIPNTIGTDTSNIEYAAKAFITYITSMAKRFVDVVSDIVAGETMTETIINGGILAAVFVVLGYLAMVIAKFIRFLFYAAAIFTVGVTILYIMGLI